MSSDIKVNLQRVGAVLGIIVAIAGLVSAWVLLPYRMDAAEKRINAIEVDNKALYRMDAAEKRINALEVENKALEAKMEAQRELLVRIDENVKALKEAQTRPSR